MNINFACILFFGLFYSVMGEPDRSELKIKLNRLKVPRVKTNMLTIFIALERV